MTQLEGCSSFFQSQAVLLGTDQLQASQLAMAKSIALQIKTIGNLAPAAAARLNTAIQSSGFHAEGKQLLGLAVSEVMLGSATLAGTQPRRGTQTLTDVWAYMTEKDWGVFNSDVPSGQKLMALTERLLRLGVRNPAEVTVKNSVALIAATHWQEPPDANTLHSLVMLCSAKAACRHAGLLRTMRWNT